MDRPRLPTLVRVLLAASFVSDIGGGLTLPFLLIYLHEVRHISLQLSGLLIGGVGVISVPVGPATGTLIDRVGPRTVAISSLCLQALGTASLAFVHSVASAAIPIIFYGIGQGAAWPAWGAILGVVIRDEDSRPRLFALSFQLLNLGLGIGAIIGGLVTHVGEPSTFTAIYFGDAGSTLLVAAVLAGLPRRMFARQKPADEGPRAAAAAGTGAGGCAGAGTAAGRDGGPTPAPRPGYREVFADQRMRRLLVTLLLLSLAGYGAINAGLVGYATTVIHVTPRTVSLAFAANTAFIVIAQPFGLKVTKSMRRTKALTTVAAFFGLSWVVLGLGGHWPRSTAGDIACIAMFVVFGAGEVLLSPVQLPLVNDLAPEALRGRYNAAAATLYSVASIVSPAIAGVMLGASLGTAYLGLLVGCCGVAMIGFRWLRNALTPAEDRAPGAAAT
jgi:MFS family permease